jgi:hypothetical protein
VRLLSILFLLFGATGASHERISEIAIRDNESEDENSIWSANGVTHADLREEAASDLNLPENYEENADRFEDGFLTSTGRFVDREEAARIATEAGQAKQPLHEDREGPHLQHSDQLSDSLGSDRSIRRWSLKRHSTTLETRLSLRRSRQQENTMASRRSGSATTRPKNGSNGRELDGR